MSHGFRVFCSRMVSHRSGDYDEGVSGDASSGDQARDWYDLPPSSVDCYIKQFGCGLHGRRFSMMSLTTDVR